MKIKNILFALLFAFALLLSGCINTNPGGEVGPDIEPDVTIEKIEYDLSFFDGSINRLNFDISKINITVYYHGGSTNNINLKEEMIKDYDLDKLKELGHHVISASFNDFEFEIEYDISPLYYTVMFYDYEGNVISEQRVEENTPAVLPTFPSIDKLNYVGVDSDDYLNVTKDLEIHPIYEEVFDESILTDVIDALKAKYKDYIVDADIELESEMDGVSIEWSKGNEYLNSNGKYTKPYVDGKVSLHVKVSYSDNSLEDDIDFNLATYKILNTNIASAYVYRNYSKLTEEFFDVMDIIYCAFILFDGTGKLSSNTSVLNNIKNYVLPKAKEKGDYVVISLGGGGSSPKEAFVSMTANEEYRKTFIKEVCNLVKEYSLDGLDIDWETPTSDQKEQFTVLAKELREELDKINPNLLLTAAITGGMWQPPRYDLPNSGKYLNYVNVMTYGMTSSNGNYHNALFKSTSYNDATNKVGNTLNSCSIEESIPIFNNLGVKNEKLLFGLAFYGCKQVLTNGAWKGSGSIGYDTLKGYMNGSDYTYVYDTKAQVPYLLSKDKTIFISFEDSTSIIAKCNYMKQTKCAGVMYWENGLDTTGDLVRAIKTGLK